MQVKTRYKQTEVGLIPEDWDIDSIVNVSSITTGSRNTQDRVEDGTYPFFVRSANVEHINSYSYDGEAVLTAGDGVGTGKIFHYINGRFDFHQRVYKISDFSPKLDGFFFFLCFKNNFYSRIMSMTAKSSVDSVRREMIADMKVPLPPITEQKIIAAVLSDVDALINGLDQLIVKKRDLKQAAVQQLLTGMTRLPGFSGKWKTKKLGQIATFFSGGTPLTSVASYYSGSIPWITSGDLNKGVIYEVEGRITEQGLENSSAKMVDKNTLLIALYGATSGVTAISKIQAAINQAVLAVIPRIDNNLFLFFKLGHLKDWIINTYTQGGQPNLSGDIIKSIEITLPSPQEQSAIATILSDMDAELTALEQQRDKIQLLKQGMMQELLTGRTRLV